jgi:hypothetical protein
MIYNRLAAVWDRISRAEEHLDAIKAALIAYYESPIRDYVGEFDPDDKAGAFRTRVHMFQVDMRISTLVGEFLHDLRSTLDHLAWQLVERNGGKPIDNATNFPILARPPTTKRHGVKALPNIRGGISAEARAIIDDAQPYKFGAEYARHPLWILHELWNIDKHRHVAIKGVRADGFVIPPGTPAFGFRGEIASFDEHGTKIVLVPDDVSVNVDASTTLRVMLHEPRQGIEGELYDTLKWIRTSVFTTARDAEDCCF